MRFLYISTTFLPAVLPGSEKLNYYFAQIALSQKSNQVTVVTSNVEKKIGWFLPFVGRYSEDRANIEGIDIIRLPHSSAQFIFFQLLSKIINVIVKFIPQKVKKFVDKISVNITGCTYGPSFHKLSEVISEVDPDIIHLTPFPNAYMYQCYNIVKDINNKRIKKIKLIITPAFHFNKHIFNSIYNYEKTKEVLDYCDKVVCTTLFEKKQINKRFKIPNNKIEVINIGLNKPVITKKISNEIKEIVRGINNYKKLNDSFVILFLGTRTASKGCYFLIDSVRELVQKQNRNIILLVGGQLTLGWKLYMFFHKDRFIVDLPYMSEADKAAIFDSADAFVMPSVVDSYGIVYIEAMMHKLQIIYANEPPQKEIINKYGIAVNFGNREELSKSIISLMHKKEEQIKKGEDIYKYFEKNYTYEIMKKKLLAVSNSLTVQDGI